MKRDYFSATVNKEIEYFTSQIHEKNIPENIFFTHEYFWEGGNSFLKTIRETNIVEHQVIICKNKTTKTKIDSFLNQFKPVFKHHSKHDKTIYNSKEKWKTSDNKDGFVSRLSCYNGIDNDKPQELLDKSAKSNDIYINYDDENEVYVIFRNTRKNIWRCIKSNAGTVVLS